ncbi:MAG: hypothetical protein PQJ60_04105, partial [Spirochaetales bacterium]|nr:hypothetical protein [Spirochaetales bacterium]
MTTLFMEKENDNYCQFWEITLEEADLKITTAYGSDKHNSQRIPTRKNEKSFESVEKAEKYFNKAIKDKERNGYVTSDRDFPLELRLNVDKVRRGERDFLTIVLKNLKPLKEIFTLTSLARLEIIFDTGTPCPIPPELGNLTNLEVLSFTHISDPLPPELGKLKKLRELTLMESTLTSLPEEIGDLTNLTLLNLRSNQLSALPSSLEKLTGIRTINLGENLFTSFPKELLSLTNLKKIDLGNNEIPSVDRGIGKLKKLECFAMGRSFFGKNCPAEPVLTVFPKELIPLPSLTILDLKHQGISKIPRDILKMKSLERLNLRNNPVKNVPEEVIIGVSLFGKQALEKFFNKPKEEKKKRATVRAKALSCSEEERLALLKPYQAALKRVRNNYYYSRRKEEVERVISYITGGETLVPQGDEVKIDSDDLFRFFRPHHEDWTFVERRILKMLLQKEIQESYRGDTIRKALMFHIKDEIRRGQGAGLLEMVLPLLEEEGLTREWVRDYMCRHFTDILFLKEGEISVAGEFLLTYYDKEGEGLLRSVREKRDIYLKLFRFIAFARTDDFETRFDRVLENPPGEEGTIHAPYEEWEILMDLDKDRFYPLYSRLFSEVTCPYCLFRLARIGMKHYPEVNEGPLLAYTGNILKGISRNRNGKGSYDFYCPHYMAEEARAASYSFYSGPALDRTFELIQWSLQVFGEKAGPLLLDYVLNTRVITEKAVALCVQTLGQAMEPMVLHGLGLEETEENMAPLKVILSAVKSITPSPACEERLWTLLFCEVEGIRDAAARALAGKSRANLDRTKEELDSRDKNRRDGAIRLLCFEGTEEARVLLEEILLNEKSDPLRDLILNNWGTLWDLDLEGVKALALKAEENKKLNRPVKAWLNVSTLPRLYWLSGEELTETEMNYLFYRQNREKQIKPEGELRTALKHIDRDRSGYFAFALFERLMKNGGPAAKNRFALTLAGA